MKQFTVIDSDGASWGDFDNLDDAISQADDICGNPDSPESRRARPRRTGNAVYAVEADEMQCPSGAQVNQNY
jgi:hypothetical protein